MKLTRERRFAQQLSIVAVAMTLLSALLGIFLSGAAVAPVRDLATRVRHRRPEDWDRPLTEHFHDREIEELAGVFDRQLSRMRAFMERERALGADMSHELRTALAVILSATEVLLSDDSLQDRNGLVISDTGRGISSTGIGLSLVKRICDRYGWQVRLESGEQQGTTVTVVFAR